MTHGIFHAYGLFWRRDEIDWTPGRGNRSQFQLLGRCGTNRPGLQIADFRSNKGIYILYGDLGPYYAGLTLKQDFGKRLKQHLKDDHQAKWDRFSWFSFQRVLAKRDSKKLQTFSTLPGVRLSDPQMAMKDIEALLIKAMALSNFAQMNFANAGEWTQVKRSERDGYLARLG